MSGKFRFFIMFIISMTTSAALVIYVANLQPALRVSQATSVSTQQLPSQLPANIDGETLLEKDKFNTIPLETVTSALQGTDPATIARNAFDDMQSERGTRQVEVMYPRPHQAIVTITQTRLADDSVGAIRYRAEFTTLGRSLLVNSPRAWQMVWAGSQVKCWPGRGNQEWSTQTCQ